MRHRLILLSLVLILVLIFSFTGCSTSAPAATTAAAQTTQSAETTEPAATTIPAPKTQTYFYDGTAFSDDVAWVLRSKPEYINDQGGGWECIDDKGNTLFKLENNSFPLTDFIDGAASIATNNAYNYTERDDKIVNKSGKVIFPKDSTYKYHYLVSYGAYTFVERYINTIEKTEVQTGIVDNTGEWVLEPTPDLTARSKLDYMANEALGDSFFDDNIRFAILQVNYGDYNFYDARSNEFFKSGYNDDNYLELVLRSVKYLYMEDLIFLANGDYQGEKGLRIQGSAYSFDLEKLGFHNKGTGFYDRNKNMAIDLSSYKNAEAVGGFSDGYCSVILQNPEGNSFATVIDNKGNQMFEPILGWSGSVSCGRIFIPQEKGKGYYIDVKGKTVIPNITLPFGSLALATNTGYYTDFSKNGLAKVRNTNLDMTICYIDTDGNIAF